MYVQVKVRLDFGKFWSIPFRMSFRSSFCLLNPLPYHSRLQNPLATSKPSAKWKTMWSRSVTWANFELAPADRRIDSANLFGCIEFRVKRQEKKTNRATARRREVDKPLAKPAVKWLRNGTKQSRKSGRGPDEEEIYSGGLGVPICAKSRGRRGLWGEREEVVKWMCAKVLWAWWLDSVTSTTRRDATTRENEMGEKYKMGGNEEERNGWKRGTVGIIGHWLL